MKSYLDMLNKKIVAARGRQMIDGFKLRSGMAVAWRNDYVLGVI